MTLAALVGLGALFLGCGRGMRARSSGDAGRQAAPPVGVEAQPDAGGRPGATRVDAAAGDAAAGGDGGSGDGAGAGDALEAGPGRVRVRDIQGRAHLSPMRGLAVAAVPGIVTARRGNGFFLQDPLPDGDPGTSEALFVFTLEAPAVAVGDQVEVTGPVVEFRPGCNGCAPTDDAFANLTTTQIERPTAVRVLSSGNPLPAAVAIGGGAGERPPPGANIDQGTDGDVEAAGTFDPARDGVDFWESLEAMRVVLVDPVAVGPTATLPGTPAPHELAVLARGGEGAGPRTARGGILLTAADANPERIILADTLAGPLPPMNVGDRLAGAVTGVIDYGFGNFKLLVSEPLPAPVTSNQARERIAFPAPAPDELTVAAVNVENLDPGDPPAKVAALAAIVVDALGAPDLVALEEVQDDNGPSNDGVVSAGATLARLAAAIAAAGGPAYQFRSIDPVDDQDGGEPGGNIRVVLMFRSDRGLAFVDRPGATATTANQVLTVEGRPQLAFSPGRLQPGDPAFINSRKPLAAELTFAGRSWFVVANHFNAKGGDQPLYGRFQPPRRGSEAQRRQQAEVVAAFVEQLLAADPRAAIIVMGDLNDFSFSPPLQRLKQAGLTALVETLPPAEQYTYVFQGNSQALDHILVAPSLAPTATYDVVHVNAEFAQQSSDHDPPAARLR
jgi:predicted extracellular nuclease